MNAPHLISTLIGRAALSADESVYATQEACGTFALALWDFLARKAIAAHLVSVGYDPRWDTRPGRDPALRYPEAIEWEHLNHVAVRVGDKAYDIDGGHELSGLMERFGGNGIVALDRETLMAQMGDDDDQPLYFDPDFYRRVGHALASAWEALGTHTARIRAESDADTVQPSPFS